MSVKLKSPWFVALDVDSGAEARRLAHQVAPYVGGFKLGPRLILREGGALVRELSELAPVFIDQKYYDIPSTMIAAVKASFEMGATFCTVHAGSGPEALKALAEAEAELRQKRPFQILAVTVLTSFNDHNQPANWQKQPIADTAKNLAREVKHSGLSGLVCSGHEAAELRGLFPDFFLLTPGIRLPQDPLGDQSRAMTPVEAMAAGSSALVVGRSVIGATDPAGTALLIAEDLKGL